MKTWYHVECLYGLVIRIYQGICDPDFARIYNKTGVGAYLLEAELALAVVLGACARRLA
jgi:hypothetical protein